MSDSDLFAAASDNIARVVTKDQLDACLEDMGEGWTKFILANGFDASPSQVCLMPPHAPVLALIGAGDGSSAFQIADAAMKLPEADWALEHVPFDPTQTAIAFALGGYQFTDYKSASRAPARIVPPEGCDLDEAIRVVRGAMLTRDLVNTPANDMLPSHLETKIRELAKTHGAKVKVTSGDALEKGYPLIHAVGRASVDSPRLIEFEWGNIDDPRLALVGKGVCFDSGGLDIKGAAGMLLMKKDMGGAANVLGLASMIMDAKLPVRLHVLIPAVENAISGNAFRPGDVLKSREGMTVEIGNTDAEGRLVLADAITKALESEPDLLIDMATLTGAARVALGPDLAPVYSNFEGFDEAIAAHGYDCDDPVWPMPLWAGYNRLLKSDIADTNSTGGAFAGSITAALFLQKFVPKDTQWAHFDIYAWVPSARPGRPAGGEMLGARALYGYLKARYGG
jgi:leucyl aminopeptidase